MDIYDFTPNNTVIDSTWFTSPLGTVGVVLIEDNTTHRTKAYIGPVPGNDMDADIRQIQQWGAKVSKATAETFFGPLHDWTD